jgi:hypothetical protein
MRSRDEIAQLDITILDRSMGLPKQTLSQLESICRMDGFAGSGPVVSE